jgi:hypothetical protein
MITAAIKLSVLSTVPVFDGQHLVGHIVHHSAGGVEAFNLADESLGAFENEDVAAIALWRLARRQRIEP